MKIYTANPTNESIPEYSIPIPTSLQVCKSGGSSASMSVSASASASKDTAHLSSNTKNNTQIQTGTKVNRNIVSVPSTTTVSSIGSRGKVTQSSAGNSNVNKTGVNSTTTAMAGTPPPLTTTTTQDTENRVDFLVDTTCYRALHKSIPYSQIFNNVFHCFQNECSRSDSSPSICESTSTSASVSASTSNPPGLLPINNPYILNDSVYYKLLLHSLSQYYHSYTQLLHRKQLHIMLQELMESLSPKVIHNDVVEFETEKNGITNRIGNCSINHANHEGVFENNDIEQVYSYSQSQYEYEGDYVDDNTQSSGLSRNNRIIPSSLPSSLPISLPSSVPNSLPDSITRSPPTSLPSSLPNSFINSIPEIVTNPKEYIENTTNSRMRSFSNVEFGAGINHNNQSNSNSSNSSSNSSSNNYTHNHSYNRNYENIHNHFDIQNANVNLESNK